MSSGSSLRRSGAPTNFVGCSVVAIGLPSRGLAGRCPHGLDDVVVAGAAAEVALEPAADLLLAGVRVLLEKADRRHDHPGRAEAALQGVEFAERVLHRVLPAIGGETLDRGDLAA